MRIKSLLLVGALVASPALGAPLRFGAINGVGDFSASSEVGACRADSDGGNRCALTRTGFGGLETNRGVIALNADGRVRQVEIALDASDYALAYQLLAGRYGKPTQGGPVPEWRRFDDGAAIAIRATKPETIVSFRFPANDVQAAEPQPARMLSLLLFVALGLGGGLALSRWRKGRVPGRVTAGARGSPEAEPSMRETLERRMREGRDLQF